MEILAPTRITSFLQISDEIRRIMVRCLETAVAEVRP